MIEDGDATLRTPRHRLHAHATALPELRQALLDSRENLLLWAAAYPVWAAAYPDRAEGFGFTTAAALGLREPVKKALGTDARIEYSALIAALEEDATALAEEFGAEQKRQLGIEDPRSPATEAMWDSDPESVAWKQKELERLRGQLGLR